MSNQQNQPGTALEATGASAYQLLMNPTHMGAIDSLATLMSNGKVAVPNHLRGSKADCFAIVLQSMQWGMNPFSVAQKTFLVNGTLGYESQLVAAAINNSGVAMDRFHFEWYGPWDKIIGKFVERTSKKKTDEEGEPKKYLAQNWSLADEQGLGVKVWATLRGEKAPRVLDLLLMQARTRNSTLWVEDPRQQLAYLAQKRWARLYAPDVILGVYTPDELQQPGEIHMGPVDEVGGEGAAPQSAAAKTYPQDAFEKNYQHWAKLVAAGKRTLDEITITAETKGDLTAEQKKKLEDEVAEWKKVVTDVVAKEKTDAPPPAAEPAAAPESAPTPAPAPEQAAAPAQSSLTDPVDATTLEGLTEAMRTAPLDKLYELADRIDTLTTAEEQGIATNVFNQRLAALQG